MSGHQVPQLPAQLSSPLHTRDPNPSTQPSLRKLQLETSPRKSNLSTTSPQGSLEETNIKYAEGEMQIGMTNTMKRKGCSGGNESDCSLVSALVYKKAN